MKTVPADDAGRAQEAVDEDGVVLLEGAIPESDAAELAELVLSSPERAPGVPGFEFTPTLLNQSTRFLELVTHPTVMALARHLLGGRTEPAPNAFAWPEEDQIRLNGCGSGLIAHPGSDPGWWHLDAPMGQLNPSRPLPDFPIVVSAFWILTPFNELTGATRVVPGSHRRRHMPPATQEPLEDQVFCTGDPGSAIIVPNTLWHAAGANRSSGPRVAASCGYHPWWIGRLTMDHYPIRRDVWESLPPVAQALTKHQLEWLTDFRGELTSAGPT